MSNNYKRIVSLRNKLRDIDTNRTAFVIRTGYINVTVSQDTNGSSRFYGDGSGRRIRPTVDQ